MSFFIPLKETKFAIYAAVTWIAQRESFDTNCPNYGVNMQIPFQINNVDGNTVLTALKTLLPKSNELDVATGTFEIGAFLLLAKTWQHLGAVRILIGNETTGRTKEQLIEALQQVTRDNLESEKEKNDFLTLEQLASVRKAISSGSIQIRVYNGFHANFTLMRSHDQSSGPFAIHGSSNFTPAGLAKNVESNLFLQDSTQIAHLQDSYENWWAEASDVQPEILRVIEPHLRRYRPFTVYAKALHSYFAGREKPADEWEENESVIYSMLSQYQKDGYHRALQIAEKWNGSLICDGVGSGKTYIGLMLLERSLRDDKRVLLIAPKSVAESVWEPLVPQYLRAKYGRRYRELYDIKRHTDLGREGRIEEQELGYFREHKDVIIIDEAHHFRNPGSNRGRALMALAESKKLYLLTATPINNSIEDISHLINYFAQKDRKHFSQIGIHDFHRHFRGLEREIGSEADVEEHFHSFGEDDLIRQDPVLKHVLVQRSRKYIKDAEERAGRDILFPARTIYPIVEYSLREVYANLYQELQIAFNRQDPFLTLAVYNTAKYHRNPERQMEHRQTQVIGLIRTLLLKRLESSWKSFEVSVEKLLVKMAASLRRYAPERFDEWAVTNRRWWQVVQDHVSERLREDGDEGSPPVVGLEDLQRQIERNPDEEENDIVSVGTLKDFDPSEHNLDNFLDDVVKDMEFLTGLLSGIYHRFYADQFAQEPDAEKDDKLRQLLSLLKEHPDEKFIVFTEFSDTARYLYSQLRNFGFSHVEQIDSQRKVNREDVVKRFSPYYNGESAPSARPIRILITTDVLAEGLNLQDASRVINYDLHWNPVRLMQRIGRLDRRLNPDIEVQLNRTDPEVHVWNFLPPQELEDLIKIRRRVDGKILRINRTLGIEGQFVSPDDADETLQLFNERYEGTESVEELMNLERQRIAEAKPSLWRRVEDLPLRIFSGKRASEEPPLLVDRNGEPISLNRTGARGVFCCYQMPESGEIRWYFYNSDTDEVVTDLEGIWPDVRCGDNASRYAVSGQQVVKKARRQIERYIERTYLLSIQAPLGTKLKLIAWLEVS